MSASPALISVSCKHRRDRIEPRGVGGVDPRAQPSSRRAHSRTAKSSPGSNRSGSMKHSKKLQTAPVIVAAGRAQRSRRSAVLRTSHASSSASSRSWRLSKYQ
jgi:hypothetical protein